MLRTLPRSRPVTGVWRGLLLLSVAVLAAFALIRTASADTANGPATTDMTEKSDMSDTKETTATSETAVEGSVGEMTMQEFMNSLPPIDDRARASNLAMTNANYVFMGAENTWSQSASFSETVARPLADGTIVKASFNDRVFEGRLARCLSLWGDAEYLECPFPKDFSTLVAGVYRRSVDVARDKEGLLVMTYTPAKILVAAGEKPGDLLEKAKVEVVDKLENVDITYLEKVSECPHEKTHALRPDPSSSFLERTFTVCDSCGVVISRRGSCARDKCECSRHGEDFSQAKVRVEGK
jgi:hypothetical protein